MSTNDANKVIINNNDMVSTVIQDTQIIRGVTVYTDNTSVNVSQPVTSVVRIIDKGPKGDKGEPGENAVFDSASYATTGSNTFNGNQTITGSFLVSDGTSPYFIIKDNGYVGLNTIAPTAPLDVIGNTYITGGLALSYGEETLDDLFLIKSGSFPAMRVTRDGVLVLGAFAVLPNAQEGAVAYSASGDFFLGF